MKFTIVIVRPPGFRFSNCFLVMADTVMYGLRALGYEAEITENKFRRDSQHIVFGGHLLAAESQLPPGSILYNWEQVGRGGGIGHLEILGKRYTMWDCAKPNCEEWAKRGIDAVHVPLGYAPEMTRIQPAVEDIDVLFYGSMSPRRVAVLEQLDKAGLKVTAAGNNAYGKELDALIARAKVILNVHFADESQVFEISRVGYAIANRKAVVSEESIDDYAHLKLAIKIVPYPWLVGACLELVRDDIARHEFAIAGFDEFRSRPECEILDAVLPIPA